MRVSHYVFCLSLAATLLFCQAAFGLFLRDQLALAKKDDDTHAQIELIRRILDEESGDTELREQLADLWLSIEDYDMAETTVREWKEAPESVRVSVLAAVLFVRDQKRDEAITLLEGYLAGNPEDLEITRQLAGYLGDNGEEEKVVDLLGKAPEVESEADLLVSRALARRKLQDFPGALKDFAAADKLNSEDAAVTNNRASFDRLRAALTGINTASTALANKSDDPVARISRAYWYLSTGFASGRALEDAEAVRRIEPKSIAAQVLFAEAANQDGRLPPRDALEKLEVDVSKSVPSLQQLDNLYQLDIQLTKKPGDLSALLARSQELSEAQQYRLALRDAEAALAIDSGNARARALQISALVRLDRVDDAAAELRALEAAKPSREVLAGALNEIAEGTARASQFELALGYANRAIKAKSEARHYRQRAAILQRLDRYAEAQEDLSRAEQLEKGGAQ
jgi:tetratricopeptide (TPR) repeat protein